MILMTVLAMIVALAIAHPWRAGEDFARGVAAYNAGIKRETVKWLRKATEQGHAEAQYVWWMYANGEGVAQDERERSHGIRKAAGRSCRSAI